MLLLVLLLSIIGFVQASSASNTIWTSACNPLNRSCPADTALGTSLKLDFKKSSSLFNSVSKYQDSYTKYTDSGLQQIFSAHGQYPAIISSFYIMYGKVEIQSKIAPGKGMVSNLIMQSDTGDEIDLQWFGADTKKVQSNYYGKGVSGSNDRSEDYNASSDLSSDYHNYTIDWSDSQITWSVDGNIIRTFKKSSSDSSSHQYPDSPMKIMLGLWAAGDSSDQNIVNWAGGSTELTSNPYIFYTNFIAVTDYSTGSEYSYSDTTGNSISSKGGIINAGANSNLLDAYITPTLPYTATTTSSNASNTSSASQSAATSISNSTVLASQTTALNSTSTAMSISNSTVSASQTTALDSTSTSDSKATSSVGSSTTQSTSSTNIGYETTISGNASYIYTEAAVQTASANLTAHIEYLVTSANHTYTVSKLESLVTHSSTVMKTVTSCSNNACNTTVDTQTDRNVIVGTDTTPITKYTTEEKTVLSTITSCSNNQCQETSATPTVTGTYIVSTKIVTNEHTVVDTITSCLNGTCTKKLSTTTATHESTVVDTITSCASNACSKTNSLSYVKGENTVLSGITYGVSYGVSSSDDTIFTQTTLLETKYNSNFVTVTTGESSAKETLNAVASTKETLNAVASTSTIQSVVSSSNISHNLSSIFEGSAPASIKGSYLSISIIAATLSFLVFV